MAKKSTLPDPFPLELLRSLHFGNADGHRDQMQIAQDAFIKTSSVKQFFLNKHSIIVGEIGTGKSTLFQILKTQSNNIEAYKNDLIIPLEEAISFNELSSFLMEYYSGKDDKVIYQLLWKFNILLKIAISISGMDGFPQNDKEKNINDFLIDADSSDSYTGVVSKMKNLVSKMKIKLEAKISDNLIAVELGQNKDSNQKHKKINLEEIQRYISSAIKERGYNSATVIIDKIDKFVAGTEYIVQRNFITALVEVDDDFSSDSYINLKVFLRADLFNRLDFSTLGYDKVTDNVVFLKWSKDETLRFLATRIMMALINAKISKLENIIHSTDLSEFSLSYKDKILLSPRIPQIIKNLITKRESVERTVSLYQKFDKSIITKLFPRKLFHYDISSRNHIEIDIFDFLESHFLDGNNVCTPRYMLIFLKEVVNKVASYYDDNPDQKPQLMLINKDFEWDLFKKYCVYEAYVSAKNIYIKNIGTVDTKWTQNFNVFLSKRKNKSQFNFQWLKENIPNTTENEIIDFLSFLQVIGFFKISQQHSDIRKRLYELPILYKISPPLHK